MTDLAQKPPALETRFLEPAGWRWGFITNGKGKKLRYGMVMPQNGKPDAVVVVLPGLSEFSEKYFEIASAMLARAGLAGSGKIRPLPRQPAQAPQRWF
jgi:hypothetical protein